MTTDRTSSSRRGRFWVVLMTLIAIAACREAAFARNKARSPLVIPDVSTPTPAAASDA